MAPIETAYYELLDVPPDIQPEDLTKAYRKMALKLHPDKGGREEQFRAMKAAYDVLKDPQKRQMYDNHGAAIVKAMDGEVLEPEVMLEVVLSLTKSASRMVLVALPFVTVVLIFPAVAVSLKWDGETSWNWRVVFIPLWIVHLVVVFLLLKLRTAVSGPLLEPEDEDVDPIERAAAEEKKHKMKWMVTVSIGVVLLLIIQEAILAGKLEGDLNTTSWFVVLLPYLGFEVCIIYMRLRLMVGSVSGPTFAILIALLTAFSWGLLRLLTVALAAAKADGKLPISWTLCLIPMLIGASCKLVWSCRTPKDARTMQEEEEAFSSGPTFCMACVSIAVWLSMLLLAAGKMDGHHYSAFLVFLPFFLLVAQLFCCCCCLACAGPAVLSAFVKQEKANREEAQTLNGDSASQAAHYSSTVP